MSKDNIPPIIQNWIEKLRSPHEKDYVKENYRMMAENLIEVLQNEVKRYKGFRQ